jgi:hypothetical protein
MFDWFGFCFFFFLEVLEKKVLFWGLKENRGTLIGFVLFWMRSSTQSLGCVFSVAIFFWVLFGW